MASTMHGGMIDAWSTMLPPLADPAVGRWFAAPSGIHRCPGPRSAPGDGRMSLLAALGDYAASAGAWARMARRHQLIQPSEHLGAKLAFADGTTSSVFRETRTVGTTTEEPTLLVIRFRLALLDDLVPLHLGFRHECVLHTPLFAGFPGFRAKLWLDDRDTRMYRGVYQWGGFEPAVAYAGRMVGLLAPFSTRDTARFHAVRGLRLSEYLSDPDATAGGASDDWWRLTRPLTPPA